MNSLLNRIIESKKNELASIMRRTPESELCEAAASREPARGFAAAIAKRNPPAVIAELKKASPTKGLLRADFDVEGLAREYTEGGAAALSVLTEKFFFLGDLSYIGRAKAVSPLPVLRKDFIIDEYQIAETRAAGADAVLLIVAALKQPLLADLLELAHEFGLDALVEVHDEYELERVAELPCDVIGVNNRNLKSGLVDLKTSLTLAAKIPPEYCKISESGIKSRADMQKLLEAGYNGFLIGEALVTQPRPGLALKELTGAQQEGLS
ncbi:MAG: indole-3-glycerol phosphate synthase TrpC [bacterium]